ncbi:hypothetical protein DSM106972_074890 [Dulcicalothrix desertica PCC 7102]|uniref:Uncharacterized protein n=1 Tax=Dulcicalothrix desertica PCC 7102 TaxID=232991 RepID=A0A433V2P5_9CYAN|nr:hypothetical protein DSM106972_074890 [Dulcicalothrix desertica PCC 7102]
MAPHRTNSAKLSVTTAIQAPKLKITQQITYNPVLSVIIKIIIAEHLHIAEKLDNITCISFAIVKT